MTDTPDRDRLIWMFTQMLRIREFEEAVKRTFIDHPGVIRGHTHLADGAEASIVGSLAAIRPGDQVLSTYRCHGYPITLGTDTKAMMAEIYGRRDGLCKGLRRLHASRRRRPRLPRGPRGSSRPGIPHAAGAAYAAQIRGEGQVVLSFFGDGASKQGAFHETLNLASLWKLPIVFVMENNGYNVPHALGAGGRERRGGRGPVGQGEGATACPASPSTAATRCSSTRRSARPSRAPAPARGRRWSSPSVYRLTRPREHHRPARRPAALPRARGDREVRGARGVRGRPPRRPGAALPRPAGHRRHDDGRGGRPDRRATCGRRSPRPSSSASPARSPSSSRRASTSTPEDGETHGTRAALHRRHRRGHQARDGARPHRPVLRPEHGDDRERGLRHVVRARPRARDADLGDRRDRHRHRRRDGRLPPRRRALHGRVHARRHGPGDQRGAALPLHVRRPGQGAARAQGRLRLHRRLGGPAHGHARRAVHGRAGPEGRGARARQPTPRA